MVETEGTFKSIFSSLVGILKGPVDLEVFNLSIIYSISLVVTGKRKQLFLTGSGIYLSNVAPAKGILAASSGPMVTK